MSAKAISDILTRSASVKLATAEHCSAAAFEASRMIANGLRDGGKLMLCGNGGSAADAQHLAAEFVATLDHQRPRQGLAAMALTTDTSALTAIGNDYGFKYIFSRQIEAIGNKGDIVIAITTSGNSLNLIEALKIAKRKKILTFCFSGNKGGKLKRYAQYPIILNSNETDVLQVAEIAIGQIYCSILEDYFFK